MIDLALETLISPHDVTRILPVRPSGKRIHISVVYRWMSDGCRGVRLEYVQAGSRRVTSFEALARFCAALSANDNARRPACVVVPASRQKAIKAAEAEINRSTARPTATPQNIARSRQRTG